MREESQHKQSLNHPLSGTFEDFLAMSSVASAKTEALGQKHFLVSERLAIRSTAQDFLTVSATKTLISQRNVQPTNSLIKFHLNLEDDTLFSVGA